MPLGNELSESGRVTRTVSGSTCNTSPITVPTSVSWPCPEEVVCMVAVMAPRPSILTRQESMKVDVVIAGLSSASKVALPPDGSRQAAMPMPASLPSRTQPVALGLEIFVAGVRQHLVDDGFIIAAVVGGAARDQIGKLVVPDQVAPAHLERIEAEHIGDLVHAALKRQIGRALAEAAHRVLVVLLVTTAMARYCTLLIL